MDSIWCELIESIYIHKYAHTIRIFLKTQEHIYINTGAREVGVGKLGCCRGAEDRGDTHTLYTRMYVHVQRCMRGKYIRIYIYTYMFISVHMHMNTSQNISKQTHVYIYISI